MMKQTHDRVALEKAAIPLSCVGLFFGISIRNSAMDEKEIFFKEVNVRADLSGIQVGELKVLCPVGVNKRGCTIYKCMCSCGNVVYLKRDHLRDHKTKSCGCKTKKFISKATTKHGLSKTNEYMVWSKMKDRCLNRNNKNYQNYGGRGISVCSEWLDFQNFINDMGAKPDASCQIDRKDNNKGYCKENCHWTTSKVNNNNRRDNFLCELYGEVRTLSEWAEIADIPYKTLWRRIRDLQWSIKKAVSTKNLERDAS